MHAGWDRTPLLSDNGSAPSRGRESNASPIVVPSAAIIPLRRAAVEARYRNPCRRRRGQAGGEAVVRKRGSAYMAELGRRGAAARKAAAAARTAARPPGETLVQKTVLI